MKVGDKELYIANLEVSPTKLTVVKEDYMMKSAIIDLIKAIPLDKLEQIFILTKTTRPVGLEEHGNTVFSARIII